MVMWNCNCWLNYIAQANNYSNLNALCIRINQELRWRWSTSWSWYRPLLIDAIGLPLAMSEPVCRLIPCVLTTDSSISSLKTRCIRYLSYSYQLVWLRIYLCSPPCLKPLIYACSSASSQPSSAIKILHIYGTVPHAIRLDTHRDSQNSCPNLCSFII